MKLAILGFSFLVCSSSFAVTDKLNFAAPELVPKKISKLLPLQTNLLRLYLRLPSELRMIAGYKEPKSTNTINF